MSDTRFLRRTGILFGIFVISIILYFSKDIVISAIFGLGIGVIASPPIQYMKSKWKIPQFLAAVLVFGAFFVGLSLGLLGLGKFASDQLSLAVNQIPKLFEQGEAFLNSFLSQYDLGSLRQAQNSAGSATNLKGLAGSAMSFIGGFFQFSFSTFAGLALSVIIAFYVAIDPKFYKRQIKVFFESRDSEELDIKLSKSAEVLRRWFAAQLLDMVIISIVTSLGLLIVGSDYWLLFGVLCGVLCIIPYLGISMTLLFSTLVTMVSQPDLTLWVIGVFGVTQFLEGNFILPYLLRQRVSLPEAPLLFVMALMAHWFGVIGVLMAPGLLAMTISLVNRSNIFEGPLLTKKS